MHHPMLPLAVLVLVVSCGFAPDAGPSASPRPSPLVDFVDSTPLVATVYPDLSAGDTVGHFVYAADPRSGSDPILFGTTYRVPGGDIVQRWRQSARWPGADTIWVWEGITLSGTGRWTGRTILKFVPSDAEWGLAIESNPNRCQPRVGATWERLPLLPIVWVGSAFSQVARR